MNELISRETQCEILSRFCLRVCMAVDTYRKYEKNDNSCEIEGLLEEISEARAHMKQELLELPTLIAKELKNGAEND